VAEGSGCPSVRDRDAPLRRGLRRRRGRLRNLDVQVTADAVPKAFVVPSGPLTPEEVTAFVAERVAPYKKVRAVELIDEIPKTPSGKVLRRVLIERERAAAPSG
jgi:acyl-CoA synthetase (AMP-forming)/AMP-acid ligase II